MSESVTKWLEGLGLGQYADAFEENAIDREVLAQLDHDVLKDIESWVQSRRYSRS